MADLRINPRMVYSCCCNDPGRFTLAIQRIDEANSRDPNLVMVAGQPQPRELAYARWLTAWVMRLRPQASEALRLAARCQHLRRWEVPRDSYPMDKPGYLCWRAELKKLHAARSGEILRAVGYDAATLARVQELNLKKNHPHDPEVCALEDALCLVFLEHQFAALAARFDDDKMINALRKSWAKMTTAGHAAARELSFGPREKILLERALAKA